MKKLPSFVISTYLKSENTKKLAFQNFEIYAEVDEVTLGGSNVFHNWVDDGGNQLFIFGDVIGLRNIEGSLSDPLIVKLAASEIEFEKIPQKIEGHYALVKLFKNGGCEIWPDRYGRVDIYWQQDGSNVLVSTSLDFLPISRDPNPKLSTIGTIHALTIYGGRPAKKQTLYEEVNRLGVGEGIRIDGGKITLLSRDPKIVSTGKFTERNLEKYSDTLLEAIRARTSDEGNVVSLSSGWDSTAILGSLVHLLGPNKVRAVIGRMKYANRSGTINQFEIDRAQAFADYYGVKLQICDLSYSDNGPVLLEKALPLFRSQQFSNLAGLNHWVVAEHIANTANCEEVIFNGDLSDGAHNLGFSQFVSIFHNASYDFREYADKMATYLFGPTFLRQMIENKQDSDPVWKIFKNRANNIEFEQPKTDPIECGKQLLSSFFLSNGRLPLLSKNNSKLITPFGMNMYAKKMENDYLNGPATLLNYDNLYAWYLHLYNSFHWQGSTVITRIHAASAFGMRSAMPFGDSEVLKFLSEMPENWGRGLEMNPTKYPLKWMLKNKIDYPYHLQTGPHSYLYDVDPSFSHMAEILFGSSFVPVLKDALATKKFQNSLSNESFNHAYIDKIINKYLNGEEFRGAEMNDLGALAMHATVGVYGN
jgi:hypothetical protein